MTRAELMARLEAAGVGVTGVTMAETPHLTVVRVTVAGSVENQARARAVVERDARLLHGWIERTTGHLIMRVELNERNS